MCQDLLLTYEYSGFNKRDVPEGAQTYTASTVRSIEKQIENKDPTIGDTQSFVFLFGNNRIIKIDTDFLTKDLLKAVLVKNLK